MLVAHPSADLYGSDRVLLETVSGLVEAGWRVVATVPSDGALVPLVRSRGAEVVLSATPVLRKSALRPLGLVRLAAQAIRDLVTGVRLVRRYRPVAIYVNTVTVPLWIVVARLCRVPVLCHVHEAEGSAPILLRRMLAAPLLLADAVVANSAFSAHVLGSAFGSIGRRAEVILNGVPGPTAVIAARAELDGPLRLLYLGRLSPRKGVDVAVEAVRLLTVAGTEVELDLLGAVFPGYEWYQEQLEKQVRAAGLGAVVHFLGFRPDVWERVAAADMVLVPSRGDEPFGNTAVEAVLAARPVVASATSGLVEATAGYACARTVAPGDPHVMAAAVAALREDWTNVRVAALVDSSVARARHSPDRYRERVAAAVDALVATDRGSWRGGARRGGTR